MSNIWKITPRQCSHIKKYPVNAWNHLINLGTLLTSTGYYISNCFWIINTNHVDNSHVAQLYKLQVFFFFNQTHHYTSKSSSSLTEAGHCCILLRNAIHIGLSGREMKKTDRLT